MEAVQEVKSEYELVTDMLREFGALPNLKGYGYIRDAVLLTLKNPEVMTQMVKTLYPAVAEKNGTTPSRVERAIRHCIELTWQKGNKNGIERIFTNFKEWQKPNNSEFIATVADYLRVYVIKAPEPHGWGAWGQ